MIECISVSPYNIEKVWGVVSPMLEKAMDKWLPVWEINDVKEDLITGKRILWITIDNEEEKVYGALVTEIMLYPREKILNIVLIGGDEMKKWRECFLEKITAFARSEECYALQGIGRKGWEKVLPDFFQSAIVFNKIISY